MASTKSPPTTIIIDASPAPGDSASAAAIITAIPDAITISPATTTPIHDCTSRQPGAAPERLPGVVAVSLSFSLWRTQDTPFEWQIALAMNPR